MPLLPESPASVAALAVSLGGLAYVAFRRDVPKAYGLAFVIFVVFGIQTAAALFFGGGVGEELGVVSAFLLAGLQWWSPLTYLFVHAGLEHLVGNLFLLVAAGPALEDRIGGKAFMAVYLGAGFAAVAAHLAMTELLGIVSPYAVAVGASGALFGILTVLAYHWPRLRIPIPLILIIWIPAFFVLMIYLAFNLALMVSDTNVAWYGHFAGFLAGLVGAVVLKPTAGRAATKKLPDPEALVPLATTPALQEILERLRATEGGTWDDPAFADAWLDRFFAKARCPEGHTLERDGYRARCAAGEYEIRFART